MSEENEFYIPDADSEAVSQAGAQEGAGSVSADGRDDLPVDLPREDESELPVVGRRARRMAAMQTPDGELPPEIFQGTFPPPEEPLKKPNFRRIPFVSSLVEFAEVLVSALVAAILVLTLICRTGVVAGDSMFPTMHNGDRYLISDLFYTPEVGDIVVFRPEIEGEDELWIKRIIAVEGQTVFIDPDTYRVFVDGVVLKEPYLGTSGTIPHTTENPITVPEGCIFVMGDNRAVSHDSRYEDLGCVHLRQVAGRVILRFWPFDVFGFVKN